MHKKALDWLDVIRFSNYVEHQCFVLCMMEGVMLMLVMNADAFCNHVQMTWICLSSLSWVKPSDGSSSALAWFPLNSYTLLCNASLACILVVRTTCFNPKQPSNCLA